MVSGQAVKGRPCNTDMVLSHSTIPRQEHVPVPASTILKAINTIYLKLVNTGGVSDLFFSRLSYTGLMELICFCRYFNH